MTNLVEDVELGAALLHEHLDCLVASAHGSVAKRRPAVLEMQ